MKSSYESWLKQQDYASATVQAQMHRGGRVEKHYGDLDEHYDRDQLRVVIGELKYSTADERSNKPNPSKIPFSSNIRKNLADYRHAIERYCKFRRETQDEDIGPGIRTPTGGGVNESADDGGQLVGLERDLQAALRLAIEQLEPGLEIIDDGAERSVASGFIDITARDAQGTIVVVELKTGTARQGAVAQVLSYMGDIAEEEEPDQAVRGLLVAGDFDKKARSAARVLPSHILSLRSYRVRFEFKDVDETG